jgi:hypothetical protein
MAQIDSDPLSGFPQGQLVRFFLQNGVSRPAIIVRVLDQSATANLVVFRDSGDAQAFGGGPPTVHTIWAEGVPYSNHNQPGTWNFLESAQQ